VKTQDGGEFPKLGYCDQPKIECLIPREEVIQLLKDRLRACWWGPRLHLAAVGSKMNTTETISTTPSKGNQSLVLGMMTAVTLAAINLTIVLGTKEIVTQQMAPFSPDVWANLVYMSVAILGALLIDAKSLFGMFIHHNVLGNGVCSSRSAAPSTSALTSLFGLHRWERSLSTITVAVNWMAANGVCCSTMKLWMNNPLANYPTFKMLTAELAGDLLKGNLELLPLIRSSTWEAVYGLACVCYLTTFFALSAANRVRFRPQQLLLKGVVFGVLVVGLATFSGLLRWGYGVGGWILGAMHLTALVVAFSRGRTLCVGTKKE